MADAPDGTPSEMTFFEAVSTTTLANSKLPGTNARVASTYEQLWRRLLAGSDSAPVRPPRAEVEYREFVTLARVGKRRRAVGRDATPIEAWITPAFGIPVWSNQQLPCGAHGAWVADEDIVLGNETWRSMTAMLFRSTAESFDSS